MIILKAYQDEKRMNYKRKCKTVMMKWDLLGLRRLIRIMKFCEDEFEN